MSKELIENLHLIIEGKKNSLQNLVDEYLKNKDNSLEDRWEVWTKYSQKNHVGMYIELPEEEFDVDIQEINDWLIGSNGYPSRYQTVNYSQIVAQFKYADLSTDSIKEYLMKENLGSYKLDW